MGIVWPRIVSSRKDTFLHGNKSQCLVIRSVRKVVATVWPKYVSSRKATV